MSATEIFLFALSFLVSAALGAWVRQLGRERERWPGAGPAAARDDEVTRLRARLDSALLRIEALEDRGHGSGATPPGTAAPGTMPPTGTPAPGTMPPTGTGAPGTTSSRPSSAPGEAGGAASHEIADPDRPMDAGGSRDRDRSQDPDAPMDADEDPEVSASQWRSAMDRLGPSWGAMSRRGAPLDDLLGPAGPPLPPRAARPPAPPFPPPGPADRLR